ncbi:hypothetical protein GCK32_010746 [Trichostrongylus colubriformis]|uniref:MOSC domain-containing protein n=1 Tax=Trichostrongylus colubriformis TaxID=6319 RepID=A0AAN8G339_TRICO
MNSEDKKLLIGIVGVSILTYGVVTRLFSYLRSRSNPLVPVGTVKELYVYPIKSCKGISVGPSCFSPLESFFASACVFRCSPFIVTNWALFLVNTMIVDSLSSTERQAGKFYTARQKPVMVTIECEIRDGILSVTASDGSSVQVDLAEVTRNKVVRTAVLHFNLRTDGLDCGDKAAEFFSKAIDEPDARLLMYTEGLHTERTCVTHPDWWNNNVPKRKDNCAYADLAPYMITTQASLDDLNSKLKSDVSSKNFRPVIVVDQCAAWDEDKWIDLQIGDTRLQCFRPCTRFRLAPEGPMRQQFKDLPIFGVNAAVDKPTLFHNWCKYNKGRPLPKGKMQCITLPAIRMNIDQRELWVEQMVEDKKLLIGIVGTSILVYNVFSVYCDEQGPVSGEMRDRQFLVMNGSTGRHYTATTKPNMVLIDCEVREGVLTMSYVDGTSVQITIERFRPVIVVDKCDAFDEDRWHSAYIGDVSLQCTKPCERCLTTTVDPISGTKNPSLEPLKTLRKYRLAPEGPMRELFKECPIFGVDAGLITPGYIHVGQTVYVRYKSAYRKSTPYYSP